ncbi:MAG: hypothetical protein WCE80_01370 [Acidimicrobiia bacterium]
MSLFSTIAHPEAPRLRGISVREFGMALVALALGATLGFFISENRTASEASSQSATTAGDVSHEGFLRLNTTELAWMTPQITVVPAVGQNIRATHFEYANVGSYGGLVGTNGGRHEVGAAFAEMNIGSYENLSLPSPGLASFIRTNVEALDPLDRIWEETHAVDSHFITQNVEPTVERTQQPGGLR